MSRLFSFPGYALFRPDEGDFIGAVPTLSDMSKYLDGALVVDVNLDMGDDPYGIQCIEVHTDKIKSMTRRDMNKVYDDRELDKSYLAYKFVIYALFDDHDAEQEETIEHLEHNQRDDEIAFMQPVTLDDIKIWLHENLTMDINIEDEGNPYGVQSVSFDIESLKEESQRTLERLQSQE